MRYLLIILIATGLAPLYSQKTALFFPKNFEASYKTGVRTLNGSPGPNYWQNRSDYKIRVKLNPKKKTVKGQQVLDYYNNSPDTLKSIKIKLQHDLYRKGGQRMDDIDPKDLTNGVKISHLAINGLPIPVSKQRRKDCYLNIRLPIPLPPNSALKMTCNWEFKMPENKNATRECVCSPGTFFIPYFYPEMAVYDDLHGWANAPYNGLQEFYHDFSNYDVKITLPKGYAAWATGEWQNAETILQPNVFERWKSAHSSDTVISIFSEAELKRKRVFKKTRNHVYHFIATDVPDFTIAVSNHYNWDATSVVVDDKTGRRAFISAAYDSESQDFKKVARITADGVGLMSTYLPGYPFPYPCLTIFNGNDGMEYPMMVNDVSTSDANVMGLTIHESAHTYFPFMMGINEQYYAWMDEGWANFFEHFISDSLSNKKSRLWGGGFGNDWDVPPMVSSKNLSGSSYWFESYTRPQLAYTQLYDMLGYEIFHKCMTTYMDRWKGKHPGPYEFFYTFNDVSGQNLDWFWKPWFFEFGYPDLGINSVAKLDNVSGSSNQQVVYVDNKGNIPVPVHLTFVYTDGSREENHQTAEIWKSPNRKTIQVKTTKGKVLSKVILGDKTIPDAKPQDNHWSESPDANGE